MEQDSMANMSYLDELSNGPSICVQHFIYMILFYFLE